MSGGCPNPEILHQKPQPKPYPTNPIPYTRNPNRNLTLQTQYLTLQTPILTLQNSNLTLQTQNLTLQTLTGQEVEHVHNCSAWCWHVPTSNVNLATCHSVMSTWAKNESLYKRGMHDADEYVWEIHQCVQHAEECV